MSYTLRLRGFDDASKEECRAAEQRYRTALEATLGDAALVAPVYGAYLKIVAAYGDAPDPEALTDAELEIFHHWQAAESAAITAAFGPHRYLEDAWFEIEA
jgi:hypothetical protein